MGKGHPQCEFYLRVLGYLLDWVDGLICTIAMDTDGNPIIFNSTGNSQLFGCDSVFIMTTLLKSHL